VAAGGSVRPDERNAPVTPAPDHAAVAEGTTATPVPVPVVRLDPELPLPRYAHPGDAGADLVARIEVLLEPNGGRAMVPTGIALAIPEGYAGFVQPRSGLALRHGVTCLNTPGLIDSGYRDELSVLLVNTDPEVPYRVQRGDRIAQLVIQRVETAAFTEVGSLSDTERGLAGFGSTGR
jgi:dUTP pyrophosphatase